jgi:hypothetical protein
LKCCTRSYERYFGRIGVCQTNVRISRLTTELDYEEHTLRKSNIYQCGGVNRRIRISYQLHLAQMSILLDSDKYKYELMNGINTRDNARRAIPYVFQCWKACSEFVIFGNRAQCLQLVHEMCAYRDGLDLHLNRDISWIVFDRSVTNDTFSCLVLPWFDRIGRMIFCKYLSNLFQFSKHVFHVSLVVFIQQYL